MATRPSRRPRNVLFLWTDEQRPDTIGAYGNPHIRTPHLDRLAAGSVLFEQAYCTQPVCSPSRASVLTGLYPHSHGVLANNVVLGSSVPTLAELLRPQGYACGYVGKWHLGHEPRPQRGFEDFWASTEDTYTHDHQTEGYSAYHQFLVSRGYGPPDQHRNGLVFSRATAARLPEEVGKPAFQAAQCNRFLETYRDRPFLLVCNFLEPHMPFFGPFDGLYRPEEMALPASWFREMEDTVPLRYRRRRQEYAERNPHVSTNDERGWKELKARYWGLCTLVDKYVGQVLQRLDELGLGEDTIVVYSTDHGDMMGEHRLVAKSVQYEGAARVPLVVHVPGLAPRRITTPVSQLHLVPTLLDLLGRPLPPHVQGTSMAPLLERGDVDPKTAALLAVRRRDATVVPAPWDAAPDEAEVFIEWNGYARRPTGAASGDPGTIAPGDAELQLGAVDVRTIRRGRWKLNVHSSGEHELYDLQDDPGELHNAVRDPGTESAVRSLYERLLAWQRETGDAATLPDPLAR